jgi:hypothetical protein
MKTTLTHTVRNTILACTTTILWLAASPATAGDWQEQLLFNPPAGHLKAEQRGRIMIYDGLKDTEIARAMDTQFDRIESMMFVRTIVTDEEGNPMRDDESSQVIIEDDGC